MPSLLISLLISLILLVGAGPVRAWSENAPGPSNIAPGTRFGREPLARKPYPYLYPFNPELYRQEQRERRRNDVSPEAAPEKQPPETEPPARKKRPVKPKIIEVE